MMELLEYLSMKRQCASIWFCVFLVILLGSRGGVLSDSNYLIGLGSYDITGSASDVNMMGYANMEQSASGVHLRLRARSFIVAEPQGNRYGDLYTERNVASSGIHMHAGPGGYLQYVVYIVTSLGFIRQSFDALVDGIEKSIIQAHENLRRPGSIFVNKGKINVFYAFCIHNRIPKRCPYSTYDVIQNELYLLGQVNLKLWLIAWLGQMGVFGPFWWIWKIPWVLEFGSYVRLYMKYLLCLRQDWNRSWMYMGCLG